MTPLCCDDAEGEPFGRPVWWDGAAERVGDIVRDHADGALKRRSSSRKAMPIRTGARSVDRGKALRQ